MKLIQSILLTVTIIIAGKANSSEVAGVCRDTSGKPIPYVNIGLKMTGNGTVSDENGVFQLTGDFHYDIDSLVFSHIGYLTKTICANRKDSIFIQLIPVQYKLNEVKVSADKIIYKKEKIVGTKASTDHVVMSFASHNLGTEIGKIIKVKNGKKYKIEKVFFNISQFDYEKAVFRINFYPVLKADSISRTRINLNDIKKEVFNSGLIEVDVQNENLIFENDFLVSIEWIDFIEDSKLPNIIEKKICFNSTVFSGPFYSRTNNLSKWINEDYKFNVGLGIHMLIKY
jgi:hypothetical protein